MEAASLPTVLICGLRVLVLNSEEVLALIERMVETGQGARMVTLNVEMLARAQRDPQYAEWLRTADLIVPDGMPIVWASRRKLRRERRIQRVTGVDLTQALLRRVDPSKAGIIGGKEPRKALEAIGVENPEAIVIDNRKLDSTEADFDAVAEILQGRRLVFLALGVPKQDAFAVALRKRMPEAILIPNGGSFELLAGMIPRAPRWMQRSGMEWLFRLIIEPRRLWRRYLIEYWSGLTALMRDALRRSNSGVSTAGF